MLKTYQEYMIGRGLLFEAGTPPVFDINLVIGEIDKTIQSIEAQIDADFAEMQGRITGHVRTSMRNNQGTWQKLKNWWQTTWHGRDREAIEHTAGDNIRLEIPGLISLYEHEILQELMTIMESGPINQALAQMAPMLESLKKSIKLRILSELTGLSKRLRAASGTSGSSPVPTPTPAPTPSPIPTPTPAPTPSPIPTPTPAPGPTPTPPTPKPAGTSNADLLDAIGRGSADLPGDEAAKAAAASIPSAPEEEKEDAPEAPAASAEPDKAPEEPKVDAERDKPSDLGDWGPSNKSEPDKAPEAPVASTEPEGSGDPMASAEPDKAPEDPVASAEPEGSGDPEHDAFMAKARERIDRINRRHGRSGVRPTPKAPELPTRSLDDLAGDADPDVMTRQDAQIESRGLGEKVANMVNILPDGGMKTLGEKLAKKGSGKDRSNYLGFMTSLLNKNKNGQKIMAMPDIAQKFAWMSKRISDPLAFEKIGMSIDPGDLSYDKDDELAFFSNLKNYLKEPGAGYHDRIDMDGLEPTVTNKHAAKQAAIDARRKELAAQAPKTSMESTKMDYLKRLREVTSSTARSRLKLIDLKNVPLSERVEFYKSIMTEV